MFFTIIARRDGTTDAQFIPAKSHSAAIRFIAATNPDLSTVGIVRNVEGANISQLTALTIQARNMKERL